MRNSGQKNHWYLVEDFDPESDYSGKEILALTPEACFALGERGISYSVIEDFSDRGLLKSRESEYFHEQLQWFRDFDSILKENIKFCRDHNIDLAYAHYYQIKNFVDSIIIQAAMLKDFFDKQMPGKVTYIYREKPAKDRTTIYDLYNNDRSFLLPVFKKLCEKAGLACSFIALKRPPEGSGPSVRLKAKAALKRLLGAAHGKDAYYFFKYAKFNPSKKAPPDKRLNVLSLHAGCLAMDALLKDLIGSGSKVLLKNGKEVTFISSALHKRAVLLDPSVENGASLLILEDCKNAAEFILKEDGKLVKWISGKCGFNAIDIVGPYFKDFIINICSANIIEFPLIKDLLEKEKVDFVISRSSSEKESIAPMLAAAQSKRRVCFQHGCNAMDNDFDRVIELDLCDYYFTMHDQAESDMKMDASKDHIGRDCGIFQAPYQLRAASERIKGGAKDKDLVIFMPTKLFFGFNQFNSYWYPLTWYFEFQKAVVDCLAERKDFRFIYKYAAGQEWLENSVLPYIKKKSISNIVIENRFLLDCISGAGRVIMDCPATALYEVSACGIPVLSLYDTSLKVRDSAVKLFGNSLRRFSDFSEATAIINEFLDSDPEAFRPDVGFTPASAVEILTGLKK